jgi:hypothetical protein
MLHNLRSNLRSLLAIWAPRLFTLCAVGYIVYSCVARWSVSNDDVRGGLRGNTILILRLPTRNSTLEQIWLSRDGTATHGWITTGTDTPQHIPRKDIELSSNLFQTLLDLRIKWCKKPPSYPEIAAAGEYYDIGLRCEAQQASVPSLQRIQIPVQELPKALQQLLIAVPAPPQ